MQRMYKFILLLFSSIFIFLSASGQGYNIQFKIKGLKDTSVFLGYYLGDKKYLIDTAKLDSRGIGAFKGENPLDGGIYLVVLPNKSFFDILISTDQNFAFETDTTYMLMNLQIKGSKENQVFSDYQKHMVYTQKQLSALKTRAGINRNNTDSVVIIRNKITTIKKEVEQYNNDLIKKNPKTFVANIILANAEVPIPEAPHDNNGNITDSLFQYRYYKNHCFDNIDFSDERLMRTPFLQNKIDNFFKKTVMQYPDSIITEIDKLVEKTKKNIQMYHFIVAHFLNYYEDSKYIGMEKVLVSIADNYYFSGKAIWADSTFVRKLKNRIEKIRPNMMGNKAPDLKRLETSIGEWATLSEMKAKYIVLVFWEPHCNHCQKAIPKLHDLYKKYKKQGLDVMAFYTQTDTVDWKKFIEENDLVDWINVYDRYYLSNFRNLYDVFTTPTFYILDEHKTIIARKIDIEAIDKFIERLINEDSKQ